MDITRNVILDLMPLYLADEVSADTKALIEEYLESDPELTQVAKKLAPLEKPAHPQATPTQNAELRTYKKARWVQLAIILAFAGILSIFLVITLLAFFLRSS